ncbi:gfo/Idh/MocA family oxidoreductase [Campylobacter sp. MIT 97-5078]|uniref:gfo/Idh/MocA family oxidoreductase n=1 Tax=Campylobacter sp. MIT 97-5078 TaxID=1548153 RepID=UPI000AEDBECC|nr:gfo/Idh/MocA family oxidoreductase [Campylobacter sp. MIT 97-5078]
MNTKGQMMSLTPKKVLIIGFGSIGKKHFLALNNQNLSVDIVSKSAHLSHLKTEFKELKNPALLEQIHIYKNLKEANLNEYKLFIIANITTAHFNTLHFLDKKVQDKIILVEKPLFESYKKFTPSGKNEIFIAYLLRFNQSIMRLKELLEEEIQKGQTPYFTSFVCHSYLPSWRKVDYRQNYSAKKELGGGVMLDLSHELDLALFFFDKLKLNFAQSKQISELEINSDDFAFLALNSKKCPVIHIQLDYFSKFNQRVIQISAPSKSFEVNLNGNFIKIYDTKQNCTLIKTQDNTIKTLENLHKAVFKKDKRLCSLKEAKKLLKLISKAKNE